MFGYLELRNSRLSGCSAHSTQGYARGAAVYAADGTFIMGEGTALDGNKATGNVSHTLTSSGNSIFVEGGQASYVLPAPGGRWVSGQLCSVFRSACEILPATGRPIEPRCVADRHSCMVDPDAPIESALTSDGHPFCMPILLSQPCDWTNLPQFLGKMVHVLPQDYSVDLDYPYFCDAGMIGSSNQAGQTSGLCAGAAPAGTFQPLKGGRSVLQCPSGSFLSCRRIGPKSVSCRHILECHQLGECCTVPSY